jgi:hypothetical protein
MLQIKLQARVVLSVTRYKGESMFEAFKADTSEVFATCPSKPTDKQWKEFLAKVGKVSGASCFCRAGKRRERFSGIFRCRSCGTVKLQDFYAEGRPKVYCSANCRKSSVKRNANSKGITATCHCCGESFQTSRSDAKFCTARCRVAFNRSSP